MRKKVFNFNMCHEKNLKLYYGILWVFFLWICVRFHSLEFMEKAAWTSCLISFCVCVV